jgi:peptidoglycan/LPS O-acetylase OafA/YrhL
MRVANHKRLKEMQGGRLHYIDYSRGLAIISVICVHVFDGAMDIHFCQNRNIVKAIITSLAYLPMLFIISGSLCAKTLYNKSNTTAYVTLKFLKNSLLPFYSLSILFLIFHLIGSQFSDKFKNIYSMTNAIITFRINEDLPSGVLWYLFTLFLCYMTAIFWERCLRGNLGILLLLSIMLRLLALFRNIELFSIGDYTGNLCYFLFGLYFSKKLLHLNYGLRFLSYCIVAYVIAISCSLFHLDIHGFFRTVSTFMGPLLILIIFHRLEVFSNNITLRIIEFIGINSLIVYVFHSSVFKIVTPLFYRIGLQNSYSGFVLWIVSGIVCPLVIGELLSLFPHIYKILFFREPSTTIRQAFVWSRNKSVINA